MGSGTKITGTDKKQEPKVKKDGDELKIKSNDEKIKIKNEKKAPVNSGSSGSGSGQY